LYENYYGNTWYDFTQQLSSHISDDANKQILSLNQARTRLALPEPSSQNLKRGMPQRSVQGEVEAVAT